MHPHKLWNHRLFLAHGDARYVDVLERILYNGFLSGVSLQGDTFFYPNPLASRGQHKRSPWFRTACCPTNVVRFVPSFPGYTLAHKGNDVYINLYFAGRSEVEIEKNIVRIRQETRYPWEGGVKITIDPAKETEFGILVRIPGWTQGEAVPSNLYRFLDKPPESVNVTVNGKPVETETYKGFLPIRRTWKKGDTIILEFPMEIHRVLSHDRVQSNIGRVALQRGPVVYCAEFVDNQGRVHNLFLPDSVELTSEHRDDLLGGVTVIKGTVPAVYPAEDGSQSEVRDQPFIAIPYYSWAHRGSGEMAVWLPRIKELANPFYEPIETSEN